MNQTNHFFLKKLHPIKAIFIGFLIWLVFYIIAPLQVQIPINSNGWLFIVFCWAMFLFGYFFYSVKNSVAFANKKSTDAPILNAQKLLNIVLAIATVGLIFKLYDKIFIRNFSIDTEISESRDSIAEKGGNIIAIIAAATSSFCFFPLFIKWNYAIKTIKLKSIYITTLFFIQIIDLVLLSSRSAILLVLIYFLLFLLYFKKITISKKFWIYLSVSFVALLLLFSFFYVNRIQKLGDKDAIFEFTLNNSNYNFSIAPKETTKKYILDNSANINGNVAFFYVNFIQYYVHGMFEFNYVFNNFNKPLALGSYTFFPYYRFIQKILGNSIDLEQIENISPRAGVYTTLFGPFFIDFGWLTLILMFFAGLHVGKVFIKARQGVPYSVLLYFFYFIVLLFWPTFNYVSGSIGLFLLTDIFLFQLIYNFFKKTQRNERKR